MPKRYDPTEYLYASARIRALELHLTSREEWTRLTELNTAEEILNAYFDKKKQTSSDPDAALREGFTIVGESIPDVALIRFLQYPYDCNNIKAIEKCSIRKLDCQDLLIDLGSVPVKDLLAANREQYAALLPQHLAKALPEAREAFEKTANPRIIDLILDRAVFADMYEVAEPFPFALALVKLRIDLANLLICNRLLCLDNKDLGQAILRQAVISGGQFDVKDLLTLYENGKEAFEATVSKTPYAKIFEKGLSLSEVEKRADDHITATVRRAAAVTYGAEIPIAYLMALENESKNLRILLNGKKAGLDSAAIQARMREYYV